jgi:hypothetical protein
MGTSQGRSRADADLERFSPTSGSFAGWTGIALALIAIGYVGFTQHTANGLRLACGAAFVAVLVWSTQLRPRVTAGPGELRLHGSLRDTFVPYEAIDDVSMGQTLNVWVDGRRYVCVGIGRPIGYEMRQRVRSRGQGGLLAGNRRYDFDAADTVESRDSATTYASFVLDRITDLVAAARKDGRPASPPQVRREYAVPEVVGLVVTGAAFLASLFV